ncbi:sugar phosphate nucleotidyltransferase [Paenibacillus camerounensis]|uniref:sugar phosphate nucleotidyltransferase n=1 Tax=Paenibacillus camerounensis TaxID=1243663 RepID=UPI0005A7EF22|nr:sugar phosphate nucleotidyltransferase [Paenibacillus camerounensis]
MQHTILLCGGSGQRLWPLSGEIRSKMFLNLLPAPDGGTESMLSRVCRQLTEAGLGGSALFVAHKDQQALVRRYTGSTYPVIGEPYKRGTFTAAALGVLHLCSTGKAQPEDTVCVAPADMFADDDFFQLFHRFAGVLTASGAELALLGTRPAYPSDQYGYIVPGTGGSAGCDPVLSFAEKPGSSRAEELIRKQALWNCGVFAFRVSFMLSKLAQMGLPAEHDAFAGLYSGLPVRSFDKEIAERSSRAVVLRHEGAWSDLGSWAALTSELERMVTGHGGIWGESQNSVIVNALDIPLHVIGVPGIIAAASPEGILIAGIHEANAIKTVLQEHSAAPRYGETGWGSYTVLDEASSGADRILTVKLCILPDHGLAEAAGQHSGKHWRIISGHGLLQQSGMLMAVTAGDFIAFGRDEQHGIRAAAAMEIIEIRTLGEADSGPVYTS